jgi:branched-chain amino acid transport system permease protein
MSAHIGRPVIKYGRVLGVAVVVVAVAIGFAHGASDYAVYSTDLALLAVIGAVGLNMLTGNAGQASIGGAAFLGIGGFTAGLAGPHMTMLLAVIVSGVVAGLVGALVGLPSVRLRGLYLLITTIALQFVAVLVFVRLEESQNQVAGFTLPLGSVFGLVLSSNVQWFYFLVVAVVITLIVARNILHGRVGRGWLAIRENEVGAAITGVAVTRSKVSAFVVSSIFLGVSGALSAYFTGHVSDSQYTLDLAVSYVAMIIVGGLGSIAGSVLGAFVITLLPAILNQLGSNGFGATAVGNYINQNLAFIELGIYGLLVLVFLLVEPAGLVGVVRRIVRRIRRPRAVFGGPQLSQQSSDSPAASASAANSDKGA